MAKTIGALASSHAFAFLDPSTWDARREQMFDSYERRYGSRPEERPEVARETLEDNRRRFADWMATMERARAWLHEAQPDVLIIVGDDQNENLVDIVPQLAVYTGGAFEARHAKRPEHVSGRFSGHPELAEHLAAETIAADFDTAEVKRFDENALLSHAHREPLEFLDIPDRTSVVPVFVDAIHVPAASPERCMAFGRALGKAVNNYPEKLRVCWYASGGFSHFTAGYPWRHYSGEFTPGAISEGFDRWLVEVIEQGRGKDLASVTSEDLFAHGDVEVRAMLSVLGAIDYAVPTQVLYEPFYRAVMGMVAAYWDLESGVGA